MKKKKKTKCAVALILCDIIIVIGFFLTYGPISYFRNLLVTTSMTTMTHKYLARTFYTDEMIDEILKSNTVTEIGESVNVNDIVIGDFEQTGTYESVYEEEILKHEEGQDYRIVPLSGSGYKGYMAVIYDPSKIKVTYSKNLGYSGEYLVDMAKRENAVVAINGGGFLDKDGQGTGGQAIGAIISNGKIISNYSHSQYGGGIIGFTNDNKLYLGKISAEEAINMGIRDAVEFGPFLIVNGKSAFINGNGGYGIHPRSAIAQRKDGIVLFLVIDGRSLKSKGADMNDLVDILLRYHAYNASNLDGGNSSALVIDNKIINHPINWDNLEQTRPIPCGFIVKE